MTQESDLRTRLALVEFQMSQMCKEQHEMNKKIDSLLTLKAKGSGAFWLASVIFGIPIAGAIISFLAWWKG